MTTTTTTTISHAKASARLLDLVATMDKYTTKTPTSNDTTTMGSDFWTSQGGSSNSNNDSDDDPVEQEQFNRISGILTQLIEEANNAINNTPSTQRPTAVTTFNKTKEIENKASLRDAMDSLNRSAAAISTLMPDTTTTDPQEHQLPCSTDTSKESRRRSRLPRPTKSSSEQHLYRSSSSSTISVSSISSNEDDDDDNDDEESLFSPILSNLTTPMSRTISPLLFEKKHFDDNSTQDHDASPENDDPVLASFERLDSSLAMVDFLSRDLANYRRQHPRSKGTTTTAPSTHLHHQKRHRRTSLPPTTDINIDASKQHRWSSRWLAVPLLYIPYLLVASSWEILVQESGMTAPLLSLVMDRHIPSSATGKLVSNTAGLSVFVLLMMILHLLRLAAANERQCTSR
ncbi:hypothetical protein [Absidia glauca]|uniref:Uncharacterized protein n=1 Tax=Absidia glauca TaxID=4829 RepID=A0A168QAD7_ABSGL|nr:hypothetical protein [Absidia glauca]